MSHEHPISPEQTLYIGMALAGLSVVYIGLVLWRFEWLGRFAVVRVLLRWGRGSWSFPASKLGAFTGGLVTLIIGMMLMDSYLGVLPQRVWAVAFLVLLLFVVGVGIHDYRLDRRRDG